MRGLPAVLENFGAGDLAGPGPADRLAELLPQATCVAAPGDSPGEALNRVIAGIWVPAR